MLSQLKVLKTFVGDSAGRVDLKIDSTPYDNGGVGFGTTASGSGFQNVSTGSHTVSELAHSSATDLANYDKAISCDNSKGSNTGAASLTTRSQEHTSELQSTSNIVCRLQLEKMKTFVGDSAG